MNRVVYLLAAGIILLAISDILQVLWRDSKATSQSLETRGRLGACEYQVKLLEGEVAGLTQAKEQIQRNNVAYYEQLVACGCPTPDMEDTVE